MIGHVVFATVVTAVTFFLCMHVVPAVWRAIVTGVWPLSDPKISRSERPLMYWSAIVAWSMVVVLAVFGSSVLIFGLL